MKREDVRNYNLKEKPVEKICRILSRTQE